MLPWIRYVLFVTDNIFDLKKHEINSRKLLYARGEGFLCKYSFKNFGSRHSDTFAAFRWVLDGFKMIIYILLRGHP